MEHQILVVSTAKEFEQGKLLFKEYASSLGFNLGYQDFEKELETISDQYNQPTGALLICYDFHDNTIGCAGIRKFDEGIAELKRLYVQPAFRGLKIGRELLELSIGIATSLHYNFLRLDTVPEQKKAHELYRHLGFYEIDAYRYSPIEDTLYFEKKLGDQ